MFLVKVWLFLLVLCGLAVAQSNPGFVDGNPLCANYPNANCPAPANPLSLNQAFIAKQDYPAPPAAITSGVTACNGCATGGMVFNNAGALNTDSGAVYAGSGSGFAVVGSGDATTINCTPLPGFGVNSCQDSFSSNYASAHSDNRVTLNVSRTFTGSGQGQSLALDAAMYVTASKTNFLTSSVAGDLVGALITTAQNANSGGTGLTIQSYFTAGGAGGGETSQQAAFWVDTSNRNLMEIQTVMSAAEPTGGLTSNTGYGFGSESWGATPAVAASQKTPYYAYGGGAFDANSNCPTNCPTFTNFLVAYGSRAAAHVFFSVSQGLNEAGRITLGSGAATGLDGNATLSGGTRIAMQNSSGTLQFLNNAGSAVASVTQTGQGVFPGGVLSGAGVTPGSGGGYGTFFLLHTGTNENVGAAVVNSGAALVGINDAGNAFEPFTIQGTPIWLNNGGGNVGDYGGTTAGTWTWNADTAIVGSIKATSHIGTGVAPTGTTGTCTAASFAGGTTIGTFVAPVCAVAGTFILSGLPAAPTGYACNAINRVTPTSLFEQTASSTTSATLTVRTLATVNADVIQFNCFGY